jgi:hypothetical protein
MMHRSIVNDGPDSSSSAAAAAASRPIADEKAELLHYALRAGNFSS